MKSLHTDSKPNVKNKDKNPPSVAGISVESHIKIINRDTKKEILNKRT